METFWLIFYQHDPYLLHAKPRLVTVIPKDHPVQIIIMYLPKPATQIISAASRNQSLSKPLRNQTIRESSTESIVTNDLGPHVPYCSGGESRPPECINKNLSILPGMALQTRMPPRDILESYQNPSVESQSGMWAKSGSHTGSKAKAHHTAPSYHAQAGSATSFYIFTGRVGKSDECIFFSPAKKNENHEKL